MAEKDRVSKTLESHNDVFADIVNVLLFDGQQIIRPEELSPAENDSQYKADGQIHSQERDVSKYWHNTNIKIYFGIENQSAADEMMPVRIISYDGASYRHQYKQRKSTDRSKLAPVITLVLYFGRSDWPYGKNLHSCLSIPPELMPYVNDYKMNFFSIKDMTPQQITKFCSDFRAVAELLHAYTNRERYVPTPQLLEYPDETIDMISVFTQGNDFRRQYNNIMQTESSKGGITMCDIYDSILREGIEEGKERGRAEGRGEGRLMTLVEFVKEGLITLADAARRVGMTEDAFIQKTGLDKQTTT